METQNKTQVKTIVEVDFTAFNKRASKFFKDVTDEQITEELNDICNTHIIHSRTYYSVSDQNTVQVERAFDIQSDNAKKHLKNEQSSESKSE